MKINQILSSQLNEHQVSEHYDVAEAAAPSWTQGMQGGIRPPSSGATAQAPGSRPPPPPESNNWMAPHGDAQNEYKMFRAGQKPAVIVRGDMTRVYDPLLSTGEYPFKRLTSQGRSDAFVVGQPTEQDRVKKIHMLVQTASDRAEDGDFSAYNNSNYHRTLGRLLGYPEDKINAFINHYFRNREDLAQTIYEEDNPYGYEIGQTVKLNDGRQGRVIDIFDDSIEVLLVGGRTITVDFRDAVVMNEQDMAEGYYDFDDYYNARRAGEYGRDLSHRDAGSYGPGAGRDDALKGQSKNLPADPFARTSGVTPKGDGVGRVHKIALPGEVDEANNEKIGGRYDPDEFDAMVGRLKKLAGAGPMKTVYDPNTRRYKNVPVAQQPQDKK